MKIQSSKFKIKRFFKILFTVHCSLFTVFLLFTIHYSLFTDTVTATDKWPGVDESVVEKYAKEHGREAREPFINTDQGDLLLFVFLLAGTIGGFAAGYYWKELIVKGQRHDSCEKQKIKS
ncbi:MAG: hypothetical protein WA104_00470 [Thermodesulfovibrionales bacterium]